MVDTTVERWHRVVVERHAKPGHHLTILLTCMKPTMLKLITAEILEDCVTPLGVLLITHLMDGNIAIYHNVALVLHKI